MAKLYKEERNFGLMFSGMVLALVGFRYYRVELYSIPVVVFGVFLTFLAVLLPKMFVYPLKGWILLGDFMGKINSYLILTLIFIVLIIPMGLIRRLVKGDTLSLKSEPKPSCWHRSESRKNRFDLQF